MPSTIARDRVAERLVDDLPDGVVVVGRLGADDHAARSSAGSASSARNVADSSGMAARPAGLDVELVEDRCACGSRCRSPPTAHAATRTARRSGPSASNTRRTTSCGATVPFQRFSCRRNATS
jgi:hypothetical protein